MDARKIFALIVFLLFAAPALAQQAGEAVISQGASENQNGETDIAQQISVSDITSDADIQKRISRILVTTDWFEDIDVTVQDSVAFIDGSTSEQQHKHWASQLARNTEGVAAVVNRLEVEKAVSFSQALKVVIDSVKSLWKDFLARSPLILAGIVALLLTSLVSRLAKLLLTRITLFNRLRVSLQDLMQQFVTILIWVAGLLVAGVIVFPGLTPSKALTVLGLGSIAIGFAFKDIFENFFAGILILWKYPFDRGDYIESGEIHGRIEKITIRMTMIRQVDGQLVVVPNSLLFKNPVDVLTNRPYRRTTIICGVAYDTDLQKARNVLQKAVETCETVRKDQPIEVFGQEFADSSINFELTWWTEPKPLDIRRSRDEVVLAIKRSLDAAGIEIPFPQRTLWLPAPVRVQESQTIES